VQERRETHEDEEGVDSTVQVGWVIKGLLSYPSRRSSWANARTSSKQYPPRASIGACEWVGSLVHGCASGCVSGRADGSASPSTRFTAAVPHSDGATLRALMSNVSYGTRSRCATKRRLSPASDGGPVVPSVARTPRKSRYSVTKSSVVMMVDPVPELRSCSHGWATRRRDVGANCTLSVPRSPPC
jgi:hypothetical protein